jgi:integrase
MPRPVLIPTYRKDSQTDRGIVTLRDALGTRRTIRLKGAYGSDESRAHYGRIIAEWEASGRCLRLQAEPISVSKLILAYWRHVETHYRRPDGSPTSEVGNVRRALRPVRKLYGQTAVAAFDALALEAIRAVLIVDGHCRTQVNKDVSRVRRMFKWGASKGLCPVAVLQSLNTVEGLRAGRTVARESEPIKPVAVHVVQATLPTLPPPAAAMVQVQLLTGMRPGEIVAMRGIDLDTAGKMWAYRPGSDEGPHGRHKTAHRGRDRIILIGPRAQEILRPWLRLKLEECLFQPREAVAWHNQQRRAARKTPLTPSQKSRKLKRGAKWAARDHYDVSSYANTIARACEKAKVPHWHPNQLRHAKATEIRREFGLDAARAVLGHSAPVVTEVYAELDQGKAAEVMAKLG